MRRGRHPLGGRAMTRAEHDARRRAKEQGKEIPPPPALPEIREAPPAPPPPPVKSNPNAGDEILALSSMRSCWFHAEERFENHIRRLCQQWTGDRGETAFFLRELTQGRSSNVPIALAFITKPLVDQLLNLRKGREHVDRALKMSAGRNPKFAGSRIVTNIPEGYISNDEAKARLNVESISYLRGAAFYVVNARAVTFGGVGVGMGRRRYFYEADVEAAKRVLEEEQNERLSRRLGYLAKLKRSKAPIDALLASEVARRCDLKVATLTNNEGKDCAHLPKMYRFGSRWYSFEEDIEAFLRRRDQFNLLSKRGWLDTRQAMERIGVVGHAYFLRECEKAGIEPKRFGHHARYSPADLDELKWILEARKIERYQQRTEAVRERRRQYAKQHRKERHDRRRQQRAKEREQLDRLARITRPAGIPEGAIPLSKALLRIGMSSRRFDKIQVGKSQTPIPRFHKAPNGHRYCLPDELDAFIADPHRNRMQMAGQGGAKEL
jgi:hypothetical protein